MTEWLLIELNQIYRCTAQFSCQYPVSDLWGPNSEPDLVSYDLGVLGVLSWGSKWDRAQRLTHNTINNKFLKVKGNVLSTLNKAGGLGHDKAVWTNRECHTPTIHATTLRISCFRLSLGIFGAGPLVPAHSSSTNLLCLLFSCLKSPP